MELKIGNKKPLLTLAIFLIVCSALVFFAVAPVAKKVYQQKDSLEEAKLTLERDQANVEEYRQDLKYLQENSFLSEGLVVTENNRVELIEKLEEVASQENLNLEIITQGSPVSNKKEKTEKKEERIYLRLILLGDYEDFLVFLYKLQNFRYVINIDELSLEKFDDSKIKKLSGEYSLESLPETQGEIVISFNQQK